MPETRQGVLGRTWIRRAIPASVVAILVVGGTLMVRNNASASSVDTYRTTTVATGSVEQRLVLTGTAQRVNQVSHSFAVAGTVSSVSVAVGDTVKAGQTLATLDPAPLNSAVTADKATLAQAKAALESDQTATTATTTATKTQTSTPAQPNTATAAPTTSPIVASPSGRSAASANQNLAAAQKRVATAQGTIAADLGAATTALAQCAAFLPSEPGSNPTPRDSTSSPTTAPETTGTPTTSDSTPRSTATASATTTTPATTTPSEAATKACLGALQAIPTQQLIQRDQQALIRSQAELTKAFTVLITTAGNTATASATTNRSGSTSQSSTSQSSTSQSATQSTTNQSSSAPTGAAGDSAAGRVVSDQAAVTKAEAALSSALTNLASATLKTSIAGTVGSLSLVSGASSEGKTVVIVGAGAVEVTVNVPLTSMATVQVGQKANVTPQGATSSVPGAVTSISLLPTAAATGTGSGTGAAQPTATTSTPTYPVVVLVPDAPPALASGSRAEVSLLIGSVAGILTVPNSALTPLGSGQATATTFKDGVATRALVKTGYAGTLTTQISSGLTAGQQVVIADLSAALPTNTTSSRRFGVGTGAAGGLSSAGLGGGTITGGTGFIPRG